MSVVETLKSIAGFDESIQTTQYRCTDCGNEFESAKDRGRATCMECMGNDLETVEEA